MITTGGGGGGGGTYWSIGTLEGDPANGSLGIDGGGQGASRRDALQAEDGETNKGGGGGGGTAANGNTTYNGGSGGSGRVVLRYADTFAAASATTGSPTVTVSGGYRTYDFTGSGSITF